MSDLSALPEPPDGERLAPLAPALDRRVRRLRARLILVPFSFPGWIRLRRTSPEAAQRLFLEMLLNIAQSLVAAIVLLAIALLAVFREQIIASLAAWVVEQGLVR